MASGSITLTQDLLHQFTRRILDAQPACPNLLPGSTESLVLQDPPFKHTRCQDIGRTLGFHAYASFRAKS